MTMKIFPTLAALACAGLLAACNADAPDPATPGQADPAIPGAGDTSINAPADTTPAPAAEDSPGGGDAARPAAGTPAATPLTRVTEFVATGNEPFWSVEVDGDTLVYSTPEQMPGTTMQAEREDRPGAAVFRGRDGELAFELVIADEPCQDSMSGWDHDFTATFNHGERSLTGCARRATDPVGEPR
jgi:uncharacterized membrane protein